MGDSVTFAKCKTLLKHGKVSKVTKSFDLIDRQYADTLPRHPSDTLPTQIRYVSNNNNRPILKSATREKVFLAQMKVKYLSHLYIEIEYGDCHGQNYGKET